MPMTAPTSSIATKMYLFLENHDSEGLIPALNENSAVLLGAGSGAEEGCGAVSTVLGAGAV